MYTKATLSVLGMYNTDSTLFDLIHLPEDLDHDVLVNNILMECSELEVLYTNPSFLKFAIDNWSKKELPVWQKLTDLWSSEMDLSGEYDYERKRTPNLSHSKTGTETDVKTGNKELTKTGSESNNKTGSITDTGSDNRTANLTNTSQVSSYNSSEWENREKNTETGTDNHALSNTQTFNNLTDTVSFTNRKDTEKYNDITDTTTHNTSVSETGTDTITEKGHKKPLYELIAGASDVAQNNIYDYIVESFKTRFCILVY